MNEAMRSRSDWRTLTWLRTQRRSFRFRRAMQRMLSPRRIVASSLTVFFVVAYLLNGAYILSARQPADPSRLMLWLSGGMVIYGIYYGVRCAFSQRSDSLEMTPAEHLWLAGAPVSQSALAVSYVVGLLPPALMKTLLLAVVLARDVNHIELMVVGVLISLVLLEIVRTMIARWTAGLAIDQRRRFRVAIALLAISAVLLAIASIFALTPLKSPTWVYLLNAFQALGEVAACDAIQWLSLPWVAPAQLAVTEHYTLLTCLQLMVSLTLVPLATWLLVRVDRWSRQQVHIQERKRLESGATGRGNEDAESIRMELAESTDHWIYESTSESMRDTLSIAGRHWVSVKRYRWMILGNFIIPVFLCLSPLVTGQEFEQWLYVVGGVGLCTMLLAPPALKDRLSSRPATHAAGSIATGPAHQHGAGHVVGSGLDHLDIPVGYDLAWGMGNRRRFQADHPVDGHDERVGGLHIRLRERPVPRVPASRKGRRDQHDDSRQANVPGKRDGACSRVGDAGSVVPDVQDLAGAIVPTSLCDRRDHRRLVDRRSRIGGDNILLATF